MEPARAGLRPRMAGQNAVQTLLGKAIQMRPVHVISCLALVILAGCGSTTPSSSPRSSSSTPGDITRVVVVWMENEEASKITATSMPYLFSLATRFGQATEMYAIAHPSQPNYLAVWSGSTHGVTDNGTHDIDAASLASQATAAGKQWRVYAQNVPDNCFAKSSARAGSDGPGAPGTYVRKHEPAISFRSVSGSPSECAKIQPLAAFDPTAFDVAFVAPNLCNDAHDCSLAKGDAFLQAFLPSMLDSPDWSHTLLVVSFDEGTSDVNGGGNVFTVLARAGLSGMTSSTMHTHYAVLRTIEDILGLPCLANACDEAPLSEFLP